ncbi:DNA-directed RNA polymerase subunit alpha [Rhodotorula diobovata]|uniref:DNA-directed RNA polymerase subunit alpha n=1 Tax=Rhodotorula diobovata TaxID=5288 RepID=A0A5C5FN41_9BASI|nr:DNA-directed RNA polymerase subunit alpha [Rhodotorula diobovata]
MQRATTPKAPLDARAAGDLLRSAFQAEIDAIHRAAPGQAKGEVYKPAPSAAGGGGAWGAAAQPKPGKLADGSDLLQTLAASLDKVKAAP